MKSIIFYTLLTLLQIGLLSTLLAQEVSFEIKVKYMNRDACISINDIRFQSPTSCGATDGTITVDATHESGNTLQYSIDGGRTWNNSSTIGNLEAGVTYNLELRDNLGLCFESYGEIILDNPHCNTDPCVERPFSVTDYPDQAICPGASTTLNASAGISYAWNPTTGLSSTSIATPAASPTVTTTYSVTVTNAEGCTATDEITIIVADPASANAGLDQTICSGSSAQISASGGSSYTWTPSTDLSNSNIENPIATPATATTYTVTITDRNGCTATDAVTISIVNNLTVSLGADVIICPEEVHTITASGGTNYEWNPTEGLNDPASPTPSATISATTTYCVTVTDDNGCTGTDCITIEVDKNCEGEEVGNGSSAGETINPCIIGPAVVGCPDKFMCSNDQAQLVVNGGVRWEWNPTTGLDDPTSPSPKASPSETTTYTVTGYDANGCSATDEVEVIVVTSGNCDLEPPSCQNDSLIPEEEICIDATASIAQVCLPYPVEDVTVTFTVSLAAGTPTIVHGCNFSGLYNYQYNFLPEGGQGTGYRVKSWMLDNTIQVGMVNSMQELVNFMQNADPTGNWELDASLFSIIGGNPSTTYGELTIIHTDQETVLGRNTTQLSTGTLVEVDMAGKDREVLTFIDLVTGCSDQIIINRCF